MPLKKSPLSLYDLTLHKVAQNFHELKNEFVTLPSITINELYERRRTFFNRNCNDLIVSTFMHPGTIKLENLNELYFLDVDKISRVCRRLKHLSLRKCIGISTNSLSSLVISLPNLVALDLRQTQCDDDILKIIERNCKRLQFLDVRGTRVSAQACSELLYNIPLLEFPTDTWKYLFEILKMEFFETSRVHVLEELPNRNDWSSADLELATRIFPKLIIISIDQTNFLDFRFGFVSALNTIAKNLVELSFNRVANIDIIIIGASCPRLKNLEVTNCTFSTGNDNFRSQNHLLFRELKSLHLEVPEFELVPKSHLRALLLHSKLDHLCLSCCDTLSDNLLLEIIQVNGLKRLECLRLWKCRQISLGTIMCLLSTKNPLSEVRIEGCNLTLGDCHVIDAFIESENLNGMFNFN